MDVYVYYEVPHAARDDILRLVRAMQRRLPQTSRLMKRAHEHGPRETWMEIYEDVGAGFESALSEAVEAQGIAALLCGPRHVERFEAFE